MCIGTLILEIIDHVTDTISTIENYNSPNKLRNYVALGQFASVLIHSAVSSYVLLSRTFKHNVSRLSYDFLWGTTLRRVVTLSLFMLGLGSSVLKIDILLNIFRDQTKYIAAKQEVIEVALLLHSIMESLPQSILQASILFFGTEYICINSQSSITHDGYLNVFQTMRLYIAEFYPVQKSEFTFINDSSLFSLKNYRFIGNCTCEVDKAVNTGVSTISVFVFCRWHNQNYFAIISTVASSISVVRVAIQHGFSKGWNKNRLSSFRCSFYFGFLLVSLVFFGSYCFNIYFTYIHIFRYSPLSSLLFLGTIFLLFPPQSVNYIANKLRFKSSKNFASNDALAFSLSLSIFFFAPLFSTFCNLSQDLEEKVFQLPVEYAMIRNSQPALVLRFRWNTELDQKQKFFAQSGLSLVSQEKTDNICLRYYPKFCNHYEETDVVTSKLDIIQYLANYALFPGDNKEFILYMIALLLMTQIFHIIYLLGRGKKYLNLIFLYLYTSAPFLFGLIVEWNSWKIKGIEDDTHKLFLLIAGIWLQQLFYFFVNMTLTYFNYSKSSRLKIVLTACFFGLLYFMPLTIKFLKESFTLDYYQKKDNFLNSYYNSCTVYIYYTDYYGLQDWMEFDFDFDEEIKYDAYRRAIDVHSYQLFQFRLSAEKRFFFEDLSPILVTLSLIPLTSSLIYFCIIFKLHSVPGKILSFLLVVVALAINPFILNHLFINTQDEIFTLNYLGDRHYPFEKSYLFWGEKTSMNRSIMLNYIEGSLMMAFSLDCILGDISELDRFWPVMAYLSFEEVRMFLYILPAYSILLSFLI